jgi:rhodanese-related sulfurtransferase
MSERCDSCEELICICGNQKIKSENDIEKIVTINVEDLRHKIKQNPNVLDKKYYDDCHISGSINIQLNSLEESAKNWDKERELVVYCAHKSCSASREAFKILKKLGFKNVWAYEEGIKDWFQKGYPIEGPCELEYLK